MYRTRKHSDLLTSKQCMCITQQSILGHSSRIGNITMGSIRAASLSVLHKNIQPLEKYAAFLWIITRAQLSGMISLQEKEGSFLYSPVFLSYTIRKEVLPKPNYIHNKFHRKENPKSTFPAKRRGKHTHTHVAPWYELPTEDVKSCPLRTVFCVGVINRAQKVMKSLLKGVTDLVPRWATPLGSVMVQAAITPHDVCIFYFLEAVFSSHSYKRKTQAFFILMCAFLWMVGVG